MKIKSFVLENKEKVVRAAEGSPSAGGNLVGGVGYADETKLLAQYDKLGGLITEDGNKVKTGSFFDFKGDKPWENPKVIYLVRVDGLEVEVAKGKPMPIEVEARKVLAGARKAKGKKVADKGSKKAGKAAEIEE